MKIQHWKDCSCKFCPDFDVYFDNDGYDAFSMEGLMIYLGDLLFPHQDPGDMPLTSFSNGKLYHW